MTNHQTRDPSNGEFRIDRLPPDALITQVKLNALNQVVETSGDMHALTGWGDNDFVGHPTPLTCKQPSGASRTLPN